MLHSAESTTAFPTAPSNETLVPAWARVAREVHARLASMQVGDRLPPEREFCVELGVSRVTLRKAMESLHREGFLQTRRGGGTRLIKALSPPAVARPASRRLIGLVVPTVENSFISRIVRGAEAFATEAEFHVALAHDHGDMDYQLRQLHRMIESDVGGLAIYPDSGNLVRPEFRALINQIEKRDIPLVMIDRYMPDIETPSVMSDNFAGMYLATEHMILSGHRRLALLAFGPEGGVTDRERRKGFLTALQDYNLPSDPVFEAPLGTRGHEESARDAVVAQLIAHGSRARFDGIVCMQDNMAYGAFRALHEAGLRVPHDVGLVGYDNLDRELFQAAGLALTSIDQPAEDIGREAARLLIGRIEGTLVPARAQHILFKPRLVVRESCGTMLQAEPPHAHTATGG
ncbi:MAG: GntR family transcriptional regulator [Verrucomicrobiota bacterium]